MQRGGGDQLQTFRTRSGDLLEILYMGDLTAEVCVRVTGHRDEPLQA